MANEVKPSFFLDAEEQATAGSAADAVRSFRLILFLGQRLQHLLDRRLEDEGLTTRQGFLLTVVRSLERPTLGEVARAMSTTHQNAKQIALALERKGMLQILPDATDRRVRRLAATGVGRRGWKSRNAGDFAAIAGWFAALSEADQSALVSLLARVARGLVQREGANH
jgi:DNA-binding MarR family transcriptional regulator